MKQLTTTRTTTKHHPRTRTPVVVAGTAAAIVGSLAAAPTGDALGADVTDRPVMSVAAASAEVSSAARDRGNRARNGRLTYAAFPPHRLNEIFTIGPRGRGKQRLTHNERCDTAPAWSPNGRRIAFTGCGVIRIMRADGTHRRRVPHTGPAVWPEWSPSGRWMVYSCLVGNDWEVCTIRRDGTHRRQLTHDGVNNYAPDWSSAGRISYDSRNGSDWEIYTVRPNGSDRRQVTHNSAFDCCASFSPSGARIAYNSGPSGGDIYIKPIAGGPRHRLTHSPARGEGWTSWSPNGRRICYDQEHGDGDSTEIFTSRTNGRGKYRVTHDGLRKEGCDWGAWPTS
jgi:Tol biopolymer transport system component